MCYQGTNVSPSFLCVQVSNGSFKRPPPTSANKAILSLDLPASHYATQPNTANTTDDESKNKKSYIPPPPGGNVKTRTNIATIKYPQFYQHYLGFEPLEKVCLHYFPHFQTDKIHQKHLPVHQEYLQHFPPCCQGPQ